MTKSDVGGAKFRSRIKFGEVGIVLLGGIIRLIGLKKGIWFDEFSSLRIATNENFLSGLQGYDHPPLYFIILRYWMRINQGDVFLRLLSVLFGIGTIIVIIKWVKIISSPRASLVAGVLAATLPIFVVYSQEIRHYSQLLFFASLAYYFAGKYLQNPANRNLIGLSTSLILALYTHLIGIFILPSVFIYIWINLPNPKRNIVKVSAAFLIPLFAFLYLFYLFLPAELQSRSTNDWWIPQPSLFTTMRIFLDVSGLVDGGRYLTSLSSLGLLITFLYVFSIIIVITNLFFGDWVITYPLLISSFAYWGSLGLYSYIQAPIYIPRTAMVGMIPFIAFYSIQISSIKKRNLYSFAVIGLVIISSINLLSWFKLSAGKPKEVWQDVSRTLSEELHENDVLLVYPAYITGILEYHYPGYVDIANVTIYRESRPSDVMKEIFDVIRNSGTTENSSIFILYRKAPNIDQYESYQFVQNALLSDASKEIYTEDGISIVEIPTSDYLEIILDENNQAP